MGTIIAIVIVLAVIGLIGELLGKLWDSGIIPIMICLAVIAVIVSLVSEFWTVVRWILLGALVLLIGYYAYGWIVRSRAAIKIRECGWMSNKELNIPESFQKGMKAFNIIQLKGEKGTAIFLSQPFYEKVSGQVENAAILSEDQFLALCRDDAEGFTRERLGLLISYLEMHNDVLVVSTNEDQTWYLSGKLSQEYQEVFHGYGAATEAEFQPLCAQHPAPSDARALSSSIAKAVLQDMEKRGKAEATKLDGSNDILYCSKEIRPGSHLIREEIEMD